MSKIKEFWKKNKKEIKTFGLILLGGVIGVASVALATKIDIKHKMNNLDDCSKKIHYVLSDASTIYNGKGKMFYSAGPIGSGFKPEQLGKLGEEMISHINLPDVQNIEYTHFIAIGK